MDVKKLLTSEMFKPDKSGHTYFEDITLSLYTQIGLHRGLRRLPRVVRKLKNGEDMSLMDRASVISTTGCLAYLLAVNTRLGWNVAKRFEDRREALFQKRREEKREDQEDQDYARRKRADWTREWGQG